MQYVVSASHAVAAIPPATITLAVTFLSIFFGSLAAGLAGFAFSTDDPEATRDYKPG